MAGPDDGAEVETVTDAFGTTAVKVWRCRLTVSKPVLKAPMVSAF